MPFSLDRHEMGEKLDLLVLWEMTITRELRTKEELDVSWGRRVGVGAGCQLWSARNVCGNVVQESCTPY